MANFKFALTGKMELKRDDIVGAIEKAGHDYAKKVTRGVDYVVVGTIRGADDTTKLNDAKKYGVKIISTEELHSILGDHSPFSWPKAGRESEEDRAARLEAARKRTTELVEFYSQQEDAGCF